MVEPITAIYTQEEDDWTVTVAGQGRTLTGKAPGIIAARDRADQLVDQLVPDRKGATVVHLLGGSALKFTAAYMTARLSRPDPATAPEAQAETDSAEAPEEEPTEKPEPPVPVQQAPDEPTGEEPRKKPTKSLGAPKGSVSVAEPMATAPVART